MDVAAQAVLLPISLSCETYCIAFAAAVELLRDLCENHTTETTIKYLNMIEIERMNERLSPPSREKASGIINESFKTSLTHIKARRLIGNDAAAVRWW